MPLPRAADQGCAVGAASRIALHAARSVTRGRRARRGGSQPRGHTHAGSQRHHEDPELDEYEGMDDVGYILRSISGQQDFLQHVSLLLRHAAASSRRHAGSLAGLQCVTQRATSLGCRRGGGSSRYKRHACQGGRPPPPPPPPARPGARPRPGDAPPRTQATPQTRGCPPKTRAGAVPRRGGQRARHQQCRSQRARRLPQQHRQPLQQRQPDALADQRRRVAPGRRQRGQCQLLARALQQPPAPPPSGGGAEAAVRG